MNILVAIDHNYLLPLAALLDSLLRRHRQVPEIHVYLMHQSLPEEDVASLRAFARRYNNFRLHSIKVAPAQSAGLLGTDRFPVEASFRLLAPWLLPQNVERVLWLDADMLVQGSLLPFYEQELGENALAACSNDFDWVLARPAPLGMAGRRYFHTGLLLMRLPRLRALLQPESFARFFAGYSTARLAALGLNEAPDQDALNVLLEGHVLFCGDARYDLYGAARGAALLHCHSPKPWNPLCVWEQRQGRRRNLKWGRAARRAGRVAPQLAALARQCNGAVRRERLRKLARRAPPALKKTLARFEKGGGPHAEQ